MTYRKAAVIGAGVMGAGIAAHLANAGLEVELLDIPAQEGADRDAIAKGAIAKMLKDKPAPLMHRRNAARIRPGNIDDHMERLADCDLVIEAVVEKPEIKAATFRKIDAHRRKGSIVASNTSTIPLAALAEGQADALRRDLVITHFFNPPRYMRLLELVASPDNDPARVAALADFMDRALGKQVVRCADKPGFIGNRLGVFWMDTAVTEAVERGLRIEEVDAIVGRPMGIPKTGIFGLIDLVGLDLMPKISDSMLARLPADDAYVRGHKNHPVIDKMIEDGFTGRKSRTGGGFYRRDADGNAFATDLQTGELRPRQKPKNLSVVEASKRGAKKAGRDMDLQSIVEVGDKYGAYAWAVLRKTLCYAAEHAHDIADSIADVDAAMKAGYGWKYGPFEMIDNLGADYLISRLEREGEDVPPLLRQAEGRSFYRARGGRLQCLGRDGGYGDVKRPEGVLLLSDIKREAGGRPVAGNPSAKLWDAGDGVLCLEFTSKMNALDFLSMRMIHTACDMIGGKDTRGLAARCVDALFTRRGPAAGPYKALVLYNEGEHFSLGANLGLAEYAAKARQFWIIDKMVKAGQDAYKRLKYAPFPVVAAPSGMALGGGCEALLHSDHVQAHAETYPGLVEAGVGLLPAWGGSAELLTRAALAQRAGGLPGGPMPVVMRAFEAIAMAKVAASAQEAMDFLFRKTDGITMNRDRLLFDAKQKALEMAPGYRPEEPVDMVLPGPAGLAALRLGVDGFYLRGEITNYDVVVADRIGRVLTGGDNADVTRTVTQDDLRALERAHFMALARDPRTLRRIAMTLRGKKRPDVVKAEEKDGKAPARDLRRHAGGGGGVLARVCRGRKAAGGRRARENANDNVHPKKNEKPRVNWPGV